MTFLRQRVEGVFVQRHALTLFLKSIPLKPQPGQIGEHLVYPLFPGPRSVEVFDSDQEMPVAGSGVEPGEEGGEEGAGVGGPRTGGGESGSGIRHPGVSLSKIKQGPGTDPTKWFYPRTVRK